MRRSTDKVSFHKERYLVRISGTPALMAVDGYTFEDSLTGLTLGVHKDGRDGMWRVDCLRTGMYVACEKTRGRAYDRYKRVRWKYADKLQAGDFNRLQEEFADLADDWEKSNGRP